MHKWIAGLVALTVMSVVTLPAAGQTTCPEGQHYDAEKKCAFLTASDRHAPSAKHGCAPSSDQCFLRAHKQTCTFKGVFCLWPG